MLKSVYSELERKLRDGVACVSFFNRFFFSSVKLSGLKGYGSMVFSS